MRTPLYCLFGVIALLPVSLPAIDINVSADIRLGKTLPPPPPEVVVIEDTAPKGPPPWAPAHGFRRNRDYYYYPDSNVYFRPTDRTWFYLDGGNWRIGASLPTTVRLDVDRSVSLTMETDKPFQHHEQVSRYYPKEYFTKKVKIKNPKSAAAGKPDTARGEKPSSDRMPEEPRGNDKGKGKGKGR